MKFNREVAGAALFAFCACGAAWQNEMVWIGYATGWGFNFIGFGDFGFHMWLWRDIFWFTEMFFTFITGLIIGQSIKEKKEVVEEHPQIL